MKNKRKTTARPHLRSRRALRQRRAPANLGPMAKRGKHGGRRPNAGRKPLGRAVGKQVTVRLTPELQERVEAAQDGAEPMSATLRRLIRLGLESIDANHRQSDDT